MWRLFSFRLSFFLLSAATLTKSNDCDLRKTDVGSICVCSSTYCDTVPEIADLNSNQYQLYTTSKAKLGFYSKIGEFSNTSDPDAATTINIDNLDNTHQTIVGFGGAFTDATGINIARLPEAAQKFLLESYWGDDGIQYSLGRVPIGGTDFSTRSYTYCDEKSDTLDKFALQEEDFKFKIPYIHEAIKLRGDKPFRLFASAWSAPIWMKTNNWYNGVGTLKDEYWPLWAEYYLKFFDAYQENNISFWGVTTQNEPINGILGVAVQNVGFDPNQMVTWISEYLGPMIRNSSYKDLKIILHDDQRNLLPILQWFVLSNDEVLKYSDGIGIHWYADLITPSFVLNSTFSEKKELFRIATEACAGYLHKVGVEKAVDLGSWLRGITYLDDILEDLKYDIVGWTDWNMALNETGGPNWIQNDVDSPIIVNGTSGEFYKQPMFYILGHFSKFLIPDTVRLDVSVQANDITSLAFKRPDGRIVVTLKNGADKNVAVNLNILGWTEVITLDANSINTLLYTI